MRMTMRVIGGCALWMGLAGPAAAAELDWLAGRWCGSNDGVFNEEEWMAPRAGVLVGMHRDTRDGKPAGIEFLSIVRQEGRWIYLARPNGQPPVPFAAEALTAQEAVFVNAQHDFPKRVRYRRLSATQLQASIDDGRDDGQRMQWLWTRDCEAPSDP